MRVGNAGKSGLKEQEQEAGEVICCQRAVPTVAAARLLPHTMGWGSTVLSPAQLVPTSCSPCLPAFLCPNMLGLILAP